MKKIMSIFLSLTFIISIFSMNVFALENKIEFSDVNKNTTSAQAIYKLVDAGILKGDGDGKFRPNDPITRGELSKIVNMIFGYTKKAASGFNDLKGNEWFYDHVLIAKEAGYIKGYDDGAFYGKKYVTREQACAIICRVSDSLSDLTLSEEIKDAVSAWALADVKKVISNKIMNLEEGNIFRAKQNITRAEFSETFAKFLKEDSTHQNGTTEQQKPNEENKEQSPPAAGGGGGNGGTSNPDYKKLNSEVISKVKKISADIKNNYAQFIGKNKEIIDIIKNCLDNVVKYESSALIDKSFLKKTFNNDISKIKTYFKDDEVEADFISVASSNLNNENILWLANKLDLMGELDEE